MSNYTVEKLCEDGPQYAMAMLINCIKSGEPFVTYKAIKNELEYQWKIDNIFPTQMGNVAGSLMDKILNIEPNAPLINVLITRASGVPGVGAGGYLAHRYNNPRLRKWDNISFNKKKEIIERERNKIFHYQKWDEINEKLFGSEAFRKLRKTSGVEYDFESPSHFGGCAESDEHKKLKEWISENPQSIGLRKSFGYGEVESRLLSGDEIDVLFNDGNSYRTVEVKSIRSNDEDFKRGLYQCVKYREVKKAEHAPYNIDIDCILVTERDLPPELSERAKVLNVKHKKVTINKSA